jgi:hypothetical protein
MEMLAKKHLFTVTEFHRMGEIFSEDDRVELIEGEIEVWLFDLTHQTVEVYNAPQPSGYSQRQIARAGQQLSPRLLPKVVVNLTELFEQKKI